MLSVANLEVVYSDVIVGLRGLSLEVPERGIVALLGANGAGKTTCLRAITGLLDVHRGRISKGTVSYRGERIDHLDAPEIVRRGIAQVLEGRRIFAELTVDENLRAGAYSRRDPAAAVRRSYERVLELFPLLKQRHGGVAGYLSGGEQQMLAIGRALMGNPTLLLMDEPLEGLAPIIVDALLVVMQRLIREESLTVILVEQSARLALEVTERVIVLSRGRIVHAGTSAELLADPDRLASLVVAQ